MLMASTVSFSQTNLTMYYLRDIPQTLQMNPSIFNNNKVHVSLPFLPTPNLELYNSGFKYSDFIKLDDNDVPYLDLDNGIGKMAGLNFMSFETRFNLIQVGVRVKKNYFSFGINEKINFKFGYPKDLFVLVKDGNANLEDGLADLSGFGIDFTHYREYAMNYSRELDDKWTVGGAVKYLYGMENIRTKRSGSTLTTDPLDYELTAHSDFLINTSGLPDLMSDSGDFEDPFDDMKTYLLGRKNRGLAMDLGATYKFSNDITLNATVLNLGYIRWKNDVHGYYQDDANFAFEGVDISEFFLARDTVSEDVSGALDEIVDTIVNTFEVQENLSHYTSYLSPRIMLGAEYKINEKVYAGALFTTEFFKGRMRPSFTLSSNFRVSKLFSAAVSYSMINRSYNNLGMGFNFNFGPFQLYMVSDNVLAAIMPYHMKHFNLAFGLNILIRGKDKKHNASL